ncbi:response regulator [Pseudomonas resinovorans]|uniref:Response regulator n=1 Tax=Metapseudomonas resinovorans TaxID=53412 RepID=A0ABT4YCU5_METRE|nr:response regulator [Pseudomonas resinovorans]MDA8486725.1 response regulator [Pseudomonas resinovorans]
MRFLLVNEHPIIIYALRCLLKDAFSDAAKIDTTTGEKMPEHLKKGHYDFLILAISESNSSRSLSLLSAARRKAPKLGIIAYSSHNAPCLALAALERGANGYVCKLSEHTLIIEAINSLKTGEKFCDPTINLLAGLSHPWHSLSDAEQEVLLSLAEGQNLESVAKRYNSHYKTIAARKYNALRKLGVSPSIGVREYLFSQGLDYLITN